MSRRFRTAFSVLFLVFALDLFSGAYAPAQSNSAPAVSAGAPASKLPPVDKPETKQENNEFRHSDKVQWIARTFNMDVEKSALIFEDLNSAVLVLVILAFLWKVLPKAFRNRTAAIQKQLVEARSATEEANERLTAVEARLSKLDQDIEAVRQQVERESFEEERRIKQALEDERQRIVASAEHEIEAAGAAAQRELKRFAAELAVERAVKGIHLTTDMDKSLIKSFGADLASQTSKGGRN